MNVPSWFRFSCCLILDVPCLLSGQVVPLTVCQLLSQNDANGSIVIVRGLVTGTARHGFFLTEKGGFEPCMGMRQSGLSATSAIELRFADGHGVTLTEEQKGLLEQLLRQVRVNTDRGHFTPFRATLIGAVVRGDPTLRFRRPSRAYSGDGFDAGGGIPVALVIKSIQALE